MSVLLGAGTFEDPIVDSMLTDQEAFDGLAQDCPYVLRKRQIVLSVLYWGFDEKVHRGQLVVDGELEKDVTEALELGLEFQFPIQSFIPIAHPRFRKDDAWSDELSMEANNSSGFNYRHITGGSALSAHALGRAIDINPMQNPYVKGDTVLPSGARYDTAMAGTLAAESVITNALRERGWEWGGNWHSLKDYHHFEKH